MYGLLFLTGVILSMSPKVTHYFSPLQEKSSKLNYNYKNGWPFLYYFVQFIRIFFLGLNLYLIFFLDISIKDIYTDPNFPFYIRELELSNVMILYKIFSPIFFISIVLEMFIKLNQLKLLFLTENFPRPMTGKIPGKIPKKNFSTLSAGSKAAAHLPIMGPTSVYVSLTCVIIGSAVVMVKIVYNDLPNHMAPYKYINSSLLQKFSLWWEYGYVFEHSSLYHQHSIMELALGKEVMRNEVIRELQENRTNRVTLRMLNNIVAKPEHFYDFLQLRLHQRYEIGFNIVYHGVLLPPVRTFNNGVHYGVTKTKGVYDWLLDRKPEPEPEPFQVRTKEFVYDKIVSTTKVTYGKKISKIQVDLEDPNLFYDYII